MKEIGDAILGKEIVSQKSSTDVEGTKRGRGKRKRIPSRKVRTPDHQHCLVTVESIN
jgi:hypothetical protein